MKQYVNDHLFREQCNFESDSRVLIINWHDSSIHFELYKFALLLGVNIWSNDTTEEAFFTVRVTLSNLRGVYGLVHVTAMIKEYLCVTRT